MPISVGKVVEGTVSGITKFGAFIQLPEGKSGLVHISEISDDYVEKVADYLKKDDKVKVKVLSISNENNNEKISLSIRKAKPKTNNPEVVDWKNVDSSQKGLSFEDKLSQFLKDSGEKQERIKSREGRRGPSQGY